MTRPARSIALVVTVAVVMVTATASLARFSTNAWLIATGEGYAIPEESSIFTFKPTVMNEGSGDWWLYGEDPSNYYRFTGEGPRPYQVYSKSGAVACADFDPHNGMTWCDERAASGDALAR